MSHFKLGVFTLCAVAAVFVTFVALGLRGKSNVVSYHTYFDETVQGLEVGAPVRYRGVLVGSVSEVRIAPDNRHVDAVLALDQGDVHRLGLDTPAPELRTQLGMQGITGVKFVDIDFFDPKAYPAEQLPFQTPKNTIPSAPSLFTSIENDVATVVKRLPALINTTTTSLQTIEGMLKELDAQHVPAQVGKTIDHVDAAVADIRRLFEHVDKAAIPDKMSTALDDLTVAVGKVNGLLDALGGDGGLVSSAQHATEDIGALGRTTNGSAHELTRTLRDLDEAAQAISELATSIDRDPEMLVKGRAKERAP